MVKQAVGVKANSGLKFDPRAFLAKTGEGRAASSYATGQVIFAQGDPADAVFYVQAGQVKLTITSAQGKEAVVAVSFPLPTSSGKHAWPVSHSALRRQRP
jgi:CRP/FNR family transcriptional regulator, cyclic AMP receptor protein